MSAIAATLSSRTNLDHPRFAFIRKEWPECAATIAYTALLAFAIPFHEPWADEAQAWQLARSLSLPDLFRHYLRYEGSPGLWHLLLHLLVKLHVSYTGMHWISGAIALAGVTLLIFCSPFPRAIRLTLPFTFFLAFQYAVVARSYVLVPLLLFATAAVWRKSPLLVALLLGLLGNASMHALAISGGMALLYLYENWRSLDRRTLLTYSCNFLRVLWLRHLDRHSASAISELCRLAFDKIFHLPSVGHLVAALLCGSSYWYSPAVGAGNPSVVPLHSAVRFAANDDLSLTDSHLRYLLRLLYKLLALGTGRTRSHCRLLDCVGFNRPAQNLDTHNNRRDLVHRASTRMDSASHLLRSHPCIFRRLGGSAVSGPPRGRRRTGGCHLLQGSEAQCIPFDRALSLFRQADLHQPATSVLALGQQATHRRSI